MIRTALRWPTLSMVVVMAALCVGCADEAPLAPTAVPAVAAAVDLGPCPDLQAPAGSELIFRVYAEGVQIYHWNGTSWIFDGPSAELFADADGNSVVGTHYLVPGSGPAWESTSGSRVVGTILKRCPADANSIDWLLLGKVFSEGRGIFQLVTHIQRIHTMGGKEPSYSGSVGEEVRVPYTTEYLFYQAQ